MKLCDIFTKLKENSSKKTLSLLLFLFSLVMLVYLNSKITVYSDDYWYGTFFDKGFDGFKSEMIDHYLNTNGRFYVHILVPIILLFDTHLFAIVSPLLLGVMFLICAKLLNPSLSRTKIYLSGALGILCTMSMDVEYLRMSLLWISAYFNYVFPVVMIVLAVYFQRLYYEGSKKRFVLLWGLVFALLSGASTEQGGIVALVIVFGYSVFNCFYSEKKSIKYFLHFFFTLAGFLTILLAPGSWQRVDRGVEGGFFSFLSPEVFSQRFVDAMVYVIKYPSSVLLLVAIDVLIFVITLFDKRFRSFAKISLLFAFAQLLSFFFGVEVIACIVAAVNLLVCVIILMMVKEYQLSSLFLLGALFSNLMLIITTLNSERTAMIGIVLMILVAISLLIRVLQRLSKTIATAILTVVIVVFLISYCPLIKGYSASKTIVDENLAAIENCKQSGVCELNIDIDPRYRFTMFFEGTYFYEEFCKYYKIPSDVKIIFKSDVWQLSEISDGNTTCVFPTLEKDGVLYFPFVYTVSASGGNYYYSWKNHSYLVYLNGLGVYIYEDGTVENAYDGHRGEILSTDFELLLPFSNTYTLIYARADKLEELFSIKYEYYPEQTRYVISK